MTIKFGPSGLGSVKDAIYTLERFKSSGIKACEIAFTHSIYIKEKEDAEKIGNAAEKLGIELSIHAPYYINLNSEDKEKVEKSKERIMKCLEVGTWLKAKRVVFHSGFFGNMEKEKTYQNIKNTILEMQEIRKEKNYTPELAPETMGKINVFGSVEEIYRLVKDTGCSFCLDFAHILARDKEYKFEEVLDLFEEFKKGFHIHFSGIEYGEKGEKKHVVTPENALKKLIEVLKKEEKVVVINESPDMITDSIRAIKIYENIN